MNILPHNVDDAEVFKQQVAELIQGTYFGEEPHPMDGLEKGKRYKRVEDMSNNGFVSLLIEDDGDVIITVMEPGKPPFDGGMVSAQFCTVGHGGGRSPNTRNALLALCHAIKRDNEERAIAPEKAE